MTMNNFHKETAKIDCVVKNLYKMDRNTTRGWINKHLPDSDSEFLRILCPPEEVAPASKDELSLDTIIYVDRSVRPVYPGWVKEVMHPELEGWGPSEYNLTKEVELYLINSQKGKNFTRGPNIYQALKKNDNLKNCLGFNDAVEIQKKGIVVFRKLFGDKKLFCWKSIVRRYDNTLQVPSVCVHSNDREVMMEWDFIDMIFYRDFPAACFASSYLELLGLWRPGLIDHLLFLSSDGD